MSESHQRILRLVRRINARVVSAGVFGGVAATHTLAALTELGPEHDELVALVFESIRSNKVPRRSELEVLLKDLHKNIEAILDWPEEFWQALHHVWKLHQHEEDLDLSLRSYLNAGVSRNVARWLGKFLLRAERAVLSRGRDPLHYYDKAARTQLGLINLVLERLPPKWEGYLRRNIQFSVPFSKNTKENAKILAYVRKSRMQTEYDLRVTDKGPSSLYPTESSTSKALYDSAKRVIVFFPNYTQEDVAHEIGHAVWEASYTPALLRSFLRREYKSARKKMRIETDYATEELIKQNVDAFFTEFRARLNGLNLRRPEKFVHNVMRQWTKEYPDEIKGGPSLRAIGAQLDAYQGKLLDSVVEDNKEFLTAWDEHWAEGFVTVLLRHTDSHPEADRYDYKGLWEFRRPPLLPNTPFAIVSLIQYILAL
jgi:hypothetical protein